MSSSAKAPRAVIYPQNPPAPTQHQDQALVGQENLITMAHAQLEAVMEVVVQKALEK